VTVFAIMAAILDRELQERGVFSIGRIDCEAIIRRVVGDTAALADVSLTAPLVHRVGCFPPATVQLYCMKWNNRAVSHALPHAPHFERPGHG
jgi:hypothetical protein